MLFTSFLQWKLHRFGGSPFETCHLGGAKVSWGYQPLVGWIQIICWYNNVISDFPGRRRRGVFVADFAYIVCLESHSRFFEYARFMLITGQSAQCFHLFALLPHPGSPTLGAVHHLYTLYRGTTPAKVVFCCLQFVWKFSWYSQLVLYRTRLYRNSHIPGREFQSRAEAAHNMFCTVWYSGIPDSKILVPASPV